MKTNVFRSAFYLNIVLFVIFNIPVVQIPLIFVAYPLLAFPMFSKTGEHVSFSFASVFLKSPTAFVAFFIYFYLVSMVFIVFRNEIKKDIQAVRDERKNKPNNKINRTE